MAATTPRAQVSLVRECRKAAGAIAADARAARSPADVIRRALGKQATQPSSAAPLKRNRQAAEPELARRMVNKKHLSNIIASLAIMLGLTVTACRASAQQLTVPGNAKPGDLALEPCVFEMKSGRYEADCGSLVVPENRDKAHSRLIALEVIRIHATGDNPAEPIFWLEGGPGQSNLEFKPPAGLLANHDFVMVGYRGADGSAVLNCPEVTQAVKGVGDNLLSAESRTALGNAFARCFARLQEEGYDLDGYSILEVVEDMEAARVGLGYERVNLLSESYGTRVAQIYALQHPASLYRSVMIGANPPGHFVWKPVTIDTQLEYHARLCAQDPECSTRTPDLAETLRSVAHNLPRRWLFLPIDPGKVKVVTFALLFHRNTAAMVFDTYIAAEQGDPSGLALMSLAYDLTFPSQIIWGDSAAKAVSADYDPARDYATEMDPPDSILGSPLSLLQWGSAQNDVWPMKPIPAEFRQGRLSDIETLLVSGSIDFSTPAEFATDELLPYLPNGKQVILAEMGHTQDVWGLQPQATEQLLTGFYDSGMVDDSLYLYAPMDFHVSLGFPMIAKLGLGLIVLLISAVVTAIGLVAQRVQRRVVRRQPQGAA